MAAAMFGLLMGGTLASAKNCDFCNDCAYKRFYIDKITEENNNGSGYEKFQSK